MKGLFESLSAQVADPLLAIIAAHRADPRLDTLDLGVGIYRDEAGRTPIFAAVRAAEHIKLETQTSKSYLGAEGDVGFIERLAPVVFGRSRTGDVRLTGLQVPGGTAALRLAADLIADAGARVWLGEPSWANHAPILDAAGVEVLRYPYLRAGRVDIEAILDLSSRARAGDVILLQGASHNPSGVELNPCESAAVVKLVADHGLIPLVDLAYQGLGQGLDADAAFARALFEACDEAMLAYSCSKNFGLYRERTGALWVRSADAGTSRIVSQNLLRLTRSLWSMPPDHGAALVRMILESEALTEQWRVELDAMRNRLAGLRHELSVAIPELPKGTGLFAMLPIQSRHVAQLREQHGIYVAPDGRINLAGLASSADVRTLAEALDKVQCF